MTLNGTHAVIEALTRKATGTLYIVSSHKQHNHIVALAKKKQLSYRNNTQCSRTKKTGGKTGRLIKNRAIIKQLCT